MANVPSVPGSLPAGTGSFTAGGHYIPNSNPGPRIYNTILSQFPFLTAEGYLPKPGRQAAPAAPPKTSGPFNVTGPLTQTFGIGSPFNPLAVFDLMNMGVSPFVSPFAGSGLLGYPAAPGGRAAAGAPALGGPTVGLAPLPRSGGKGVMR